jgi:predicted permease
MTHYLRDAVRQLVQAPLFTVTAVASLAIGIGANAAIFSIANAVLLAPTPGVTDMARLVDIGRTTGGRGFDTVSYLTYADLRDRVAAFEGVYAMRLEPAPLSLGGADGAERIYGELVSASYFDVLGLTPAAGGFFRTPEERIGVPLRKVVLSYAFWQRRFDGQPSIVGQPVVLNGDPFTVAGVAPAGFAGTTVLTPDVWVPLTSEGRGMMNLETLRSRQSVSLIIAARLKPGVSLDQARAATAAFAAELQREHPEIYRDRGFAIVPASRVPGIGPQFVVPFLSVLMGLVALVLLVACTNLAGLLLARGAARSREIAVRLALGAPRRAIFSMLLVESLVLFGAGALAALGIALGMMRLMASVLPTLPVPIALDLGLDGRVLAFTSLLALLTGVLTGAVPALQSARGDLVPDLKSDSSGRRRQRLRHVFIAAQMAACLLLIIMAGLFIRALVTATRVDAGLQIDGVDIASVDFGLGDYPDTRIAAAAEDVRQRFAAIPGVASVGTAAMVPLEGGGLGLGALRTPGTADPAAFIDTDWNVISPDFMDAVRLPLTRGRVFTGADRDGAPLAAIVNEQFARMVWPGQNAIGKTLENGDFRPGRATTIRTLTVVGVARDAKYRWLGESPRPFIYVPLAQFPMRQVHYFLRRHDSAGAVALQPAVREALAGFDRQLPLVRMASFRQSAEVGMLPQRLAASIAGGLGAVALLLGGIGIFGVTAFAVTSRTREIGVRMALGADPRRIQRSVLWHGLRLTAIGGAVGLALAVGTAQLLTDFLFGVSPSDPLALGTTTTTLAAVALAASWIPARRAARTDPMRALRAE